MTKAVVGVLGSAAAAVGTYGGLVTLSKGGNGDAQQTTSMHSVTQSGPGISVDSSSLPEGSLVNGEKVSVSTGTEESPESSTSQQKLLFEDVETFKTKISTSACIEDTFGNDTTIDFSKGSEFSRDSKPKPGEFFKNGEDSNPFTTCLIINWRKTTNSPDSKWSGKFTWLWTFIRGDEGFINFNVAESTSEEATLKFSGVFYLVNKTSDSWNIQYKKEVKEESQTISDGKIETYFPKAYNTLNEKPGDYWGFLDDNGDLSNMCSEASSECHKDKTTTKIHTFKWTSSQNLSAKEIKSWTTSIEYWRKIYGVNNQWNMRTQLQNFKGIWTKQ